MKDLIKKLVGLDKEEEQLKQERAKVAEQEEALTKVKEIMEAAVDLDIPLIVEASIGSNWNEAH